MVVLVTAIHPFCRRNKEGVDARHKAGHDKQGVAKLHLERSLIVVNAVPPTGAA
jgi:hypothetical protein